MSSPDFVFFESQFPEGLVSKSTEALEAATAALQREDGRPFPEVDDRGPVLGYPGEAGALEGAFLTSRIFRAARNHEQEKRSKL